jgi:hypothetical protein
MMSGASIGHVEDCAASERRFMHDRTALDGLLDGEQRLT